MAGDAVGNRVRTLRDGGSGGGVVLSCGATMPKPLLAAYAALSLADWALTSWAFTAGWLRLGGTPTSWHEGNPVTAWALANGGVWAFLGVKVALFGLILALVAGMRRVPWQPAQLVTWGALGVATVAQAWANWDGVVAVVAHHT